MSSTILELMTEILRVKSEWTGFNGAPGYTNLFFRDFTSDGPGGETATVENASAAVDRVRGFFGALADLFPDDVTITPESAVDVLEAETGDLLDSLTATSGGSVRGTNTGGYMAAAGASISWRTAGIRNSRRILGRTFLVPLASANFNTTGSLIPAVQQTIQTAANALLNPAGTPDLGVWARPTTKDGNDGVWFVARQATVPSSGSILRSRRD